ncbi:MAG: transcriptional regulator [Acidobacteria bacterium]|nr:transcriptional regulator [Acidobacteriota bacterium]
MSTTPFEQLANLDRRVHDPARLAILTALSACERADFLFLLRITSLTKGNLSSHLSTLERWSWSRSKSASWRRESRPSCAERRRPLPDSD